MKYLGIASTALGLLLLCPAWSSGQVARPPAPETAKVPDTERYPDQGFLSPTRYTNQFFGFAFDLPPDVKLQPIPRPAATDGRIQLLQLGGPPPADAAISIAAIASEGRAGHDAKTMLRKELDQSVPTAVP